MTRAKNYFAWQSSLVIRELGQRVVEVGCGIGNFTRRLLHRDLVIALDIEPPCVQTLRESYPGQPNLHAFACEVPSEAFEQLARFHPDSCVCLNVLEHIQDDAAALRSMASILAPGGVIVLLVPAFEALYGPIDHNLGHYRRYTRASLSALARSTGLDIVKLHYLNTAGFFGWWLNARLFHRQTQSDGQIYFFDRFLVPILSRLEGALTPPFGQSLFAVMRKQAAP